MTYVDLASMKAHLKITSSTHDSELETFLVAAQAAAEAWCGRRFDQVTVVETLNGRGPILRLKQGPAVSVSEVVENGVTLAATGYVLDGPLLYRRCGLYDSQDWTPGVQNITVTYVTGLVGDLGDVSHALKELTRHLWETQRGNMPVPQQGPDDVYIPGLTYTFPRRVLELLSPYDLKPTLVR